MRVFISLIRQIKYWDTPTQIALVITLLLLPIAYSVYVTNPDMQTPAMIAMIGLVIASQLIAMWGNRHLVVPITQAQRHMQAGDFQAAIDVLETASTQKSLAVEEQVLLGNAYRNAGQLNESLSTLQAAVSKKPDSEFALYGLAKTYLASGDYQQAVSLLHQALEQGGSAVAWFDIANAAYRLKDTQTLTESLNHLESQPLEPYRQLMLSWIAHRSLNHPPPDVELIQQALPFWQAEVERFSHSEYGRSVADDIHQMQQII